MFKLFNLRTEPGKGSKQAKDTNRETENQVSSAAVRKALRKSPRAEEDWEPMDYISAGAEFPCLAQNQQDGDGAWVCCNGHENVLIHYQGHTPFKYVYCRSCNHVMCDGCHSTDILSRTTPESANLAWAKSFESEENAEVRLCIVCKGCGLSHRANLEHTAGTHSFRRHCLCGREMKEEPAQPFFIGTVDEYRCNPEGQKLMLRLQHVDDASNRAHEKRSRHGLSKAHVAAPVAKEEKARSQVKSPIPAPAPAPTPKPVQKEVRPATRPMKEATVSPKVPEVVQEEAKTVSKPPQVSRAKTFPQLVPQEEALSVPRPVQMVTADVLLRQSAERGSDEQSNMPVPSRSPKLARRGAIRRNHSA